MSRVLVVEDEAHLADGLRFNLQQKGTPSRSPPTAKRLLSGLLTKVNDSMPLSWM